LTDFDDILSPLHRAFSNISNAATNALEISDLQRQTPSAAFYWTGALRWIFDASLVIPAEKGHSCNLRFLQNPLS
jgi:hypothetical protein